MFNFAFCNDCDLMTWDGYKKVHKILDDLGLPAGDSFWLFDPSGGDMALFKHNLQHPGPYHDELLEKINNGELDVLHSVGSYSSRFNGGFKPNRELTIGALEYLKKNAKVPKIWTNHGDDHNIQNIGGEKPCLYHKGDELSSECYLIDILLEYGIEFFWLDRLLMQTADAPYKLVAEDKCRSGHIIKSFTRFMGNLGCSPNAENLDIQLCESNIELFKNLKQDTILYQHWGCHHTADRYAFSPKGMPFSEASIDSLTKFASRYHKGEFKISRLYDLLLENKSKELLEDVQRIGLWAVTEEKDNKDNFYYHQYGVHGVKYFDSRIEKLGISGKVALDAGCGVGQWSFALTKKFSNVYGVDINPNAFAMLSKISEGLRQETPIFSAQDITALSFENEFFDFINCYSVIFSANTLSVLREFHRILKVGGIAYIGLNGDGWYEYLVDERFKNSDNEERKIYVIPLWHATLARIGGEKVLLNKIDKKFFSAAPQKINEEMAKNFLYQVLPEEYFREYKEVFEHYSDYIITELANKVLESILKFERKGKISQLCDSICKKSKLLQRLKRIPRRIIDLILNRKGSDDRNLSTVTNKETEYWVNRAFLPDELQKLVIDLGYKNFRWGTDAFLSVNRNSIEVKPIYEKNYKGQVAVWECVLSK